MALPLRPEMNTALVDVRSYRRILSTGILKMGMNPSLRWKQNVYEEFLGPETAFYHNLLRFCSPLELRCQSLKNFTS